MSGDKPTSVLFLWDCAAAGGYLAAGALMAVLSLRLKGGPRFICSALAVALVATAGCFVGLAIGEGP